MYAITVRQPWAQAIAQFGKNVENRTRRPPAHLIGQRVAIHVGREWSDLHVSMPAELAKWSGDALVKGPPPHAGRIIATARLVGAICAYLEFNGNARVRVEMIAAAPDAANGETTDADRALVSAGCHSRWFTGPVGWVLADVVMLLKPVGQSQDCATCPNRNGYPPEPRGYCLCDAPIRGQVGCWKVSPAVAAQVREQEAAARYSTGTPTTTKLGA